MKLASYNPQVQLNTQQANVRFNPVANAYGADTSGMQAMARGLGQLEKTIGAIAEQNMVTDVTAANTEYNKRMNEIRNNLMNTQLDGARGIGASYEEQEKQVRQEVRDKYGLKYNRAVMAYNSMADKDMSGALSMISRHEFSEMEKNREVTTNNSVNEIGLAMRGRYKDIEGINASINKITTVSDANNMGKGQEYANIRRKSYIGGFVKGVVDDAIAHGDYDSARTLLNQYGQYMTTDQYNAYEKASIAKQTKNNVMSIGTDAYARFGDNVQAAMDYIDSLDGYTVKGTKGNGGNASINIGEYVTTNEGISLGGLSKPMSSGLAGLAKAFREAFPKADALNATSTDGGKHTEGSDHYAGNAVDIASDSMDDNEAERAWVKANAGRFGLRVYDEYENKSEDWTGGHLHVSLENENVAMGEGTPDEFVQYSLEDKEAMKSAYHKQVSEQKYARNMNISNITDSYFADINNRLHNGETPQSIVADYETIIGNDIDAQKAFNSAFSTARSGYGKAAGASNKVSNGLINHIADNLMGRIGDGEDRIESFDQILDIARQRGITSQTEINKLKKVWDNFNTGKGVFNINLDGVLNGYVSGHYKSTGLQEATVKKAMKAVLLDYLHNYWRDPKNEGANPTQSEMIKAMDEAIKTKTIGEYGFFGNDLDVSQIQVSALGFVGIEKVGDNEYYLVNKDGSGEYVTGQELNQRIKVLQGK